MRTVRRIGGFLVLALAALCLAPSVIPPFLDRVYYRGPPSDHFDGRRFFNPTGEPSEVHERGRIGFFLGALFGNERAVWPEAVPVRQAVPPRRVEGSEMLVTWIGHATVLVQTRGLNILADPIWSERASPFSFAGPKRVRAPGVRFEDLPKIDLVLVSHNHYDHMDLPTLKRLWQRDRPAIVTSLGNDTILKGEGINAIALDWGGGWSVAPLCPPEAPCGEIDVRVERNHHWGSRWGTDRNRALWSAFTVRLPGGNVFFAGDTGYGDGSWADEAARRGRIRLAVLPVGAYEPRDVMKANHIDPDEAVRIFEKLKPRTALGMHWGTFQLTFESIDDPPGRLAKALKARGIAPERFVTTEVGRSFRVP